MKSAVSSVVLPAVLVSGAVVGTKQFLEGNYAKSFLGALAVSAFSALLRRA